jgi:tetratricopeptide (TPR) repeat protein
MKLPFALPRIILLGLLCSATILFSLKALAQEAAAPQSIAELDKALTAAKEGTSDARKRLAVKRVVRDAEKSLEPLADSPDRFPILEFLFRARKQLIALDDDADQRKALLDTCRDLVKAPDKYADLRLEADLLLSQAEIAKQGANAEARAKALRPFVERYVDTPSGPKVLRMAMLMALELGDNNLVNDLQDMIGERFAGDLEMISFQRDKLGGQVFGAPFIGTFERSDGKTLRFPMDALGRSTMLVFWSKSDESAELLKGLAAAAKQMQQELSGRLEFISFNLDDLPDAGESIVRGHGADWQCLRLPGGKENPIYKAYVRADPRILTLSPTGYTALIMEGTTRKKDETKEGDPDYARFLGSSLARSWTDERYVAHLSSLMVGNFLVFDPTEVFDPSCPPELKASAKDAKPLTSAAKSVPEETLRAIQSCFIAPPQRYRLPHSEIAAQYTKAADLSRKAIAAHPQAPDLWIVRNRLITALLGLWKTEAKVEHLDAAIAEAKTALTAGYPTGCDIVARFCIARSELRDAKNAPREILETFVKDHANSGPALAAAAMLALDVADRRFYENCREAILKDHTEAPMMWLFTSFLLDRHHEYWLFQVPFTAGWSFGRRENYYMTQGRSEPAQRTLRTELQTLDGKPVRIPEDLDSQWTIIIFAQPGPWSKNREDGRAAPPEALTRQFAEFTAARGGEVKVFIAMLQGDAATIRAGYEGKEPGYPVLTVPQGMNNPLVHRLGLQSEDNQLNSVLLDQSGRIVVMATGLASAGRNSAITHINVIASEEEKSVLDLLEKGDITAAKEKIFRVAPPFDATAVDAKGRPLKKPTFNIAHLRARAQVYMDLKEWDKALADAEEAVKLQLSTDGGMSLRTKELDATEALRDKIKALSAPAGESK